MDAPPFGCSHHREVTAESRGNQRQQTVLHASHDTNLAQNTSSYDIIVTRGKWQNKLDDGLAEGLLQRQH